MFTNTMVRKISRKSKPIRIRLINAAAYSSFKVSIDGLPLQLIELDGTRVQPVDFQSLPLNAGQRCSFIIDFSRMSKVFLSFIFILILKTITSSGTS